MYVAQAAKAIRTAKRTLIEAAGSDEVRLSSEEVEALLASMEKNRVKVEFGNQVMGPSDPSLVAKYPLVYGGFSSQHPVYRMEAYQAAQAEATPPPPDASV